MNKGVSESTHAGFSVIIFRATIFFYISGGADYAKVKYCEVFINGVFSRRIDRLDHSRTASRTGQYIIVLFFFN